MHVAANTFLYHLLIAFYFLCISPSVSQENKKEVFILNFKKQSPQGKIRMFDSLPDPDKLEYYPLLKDELIVLKNTGPANIRKKASLVLNKFDGIRYYHINNYSSAIAIFTRILSKREAASSRDSIQILYYLKNSYVKLKSLTKALEMHKHLITLKNKYGITDPWMLHPQLSTIYSEMGFYKEALEEQKHEFLDTADNFVMTGYYNNRGVFWSRYGNQDSAISCFNLASLYRLRGRDTTRLTDDDMYVVSLIGGNIGQSLKLKGNCAAAIPLLQKDVYYSKNAKDFTNAAVSHNELGSCYLMMSEYELCEKHLDSARRILAMGQNIKPILNNYILYGQLFGKTKRFGEADSIYRLYIRLRDSIERNDDRKLLINQQVALQMEEREAIIKEHREKLKAEHEVIEQQKKQRNWLLITGILLIIVLVIILLQLKKMSQQKKLLVRSNTEIQEKKDIIEKSLKEKEVLVKEVHHRVKNNLQLVSSLLRLQGGKTEDAEAKQALLEAFERVSSMALIHQLLYTNDNIAVIPIHSYLKNLFDHLSYSNAIPGTTIVRDFEADPLLLDLDTGVPLGLIANELISNSYKHAFKNRTSGIIRASLKHTGKTEYLFKVSDNGRGLPDDFENRLENSLGLEITQLLCEQINGQFHFFNNGGACFELHFKAKGGEVKHS